MRKTMITMTLATLLTACSTTSGTGPDIYTRVDLITVP